MFGKTAEEGEHDRPTEEAHTELSPEKVQEEELKKKYPQQVLQGGQSQFLQKRLQQRTKFFDSGDYNMAKAKGGLKGFNPLAPKTSKPPLSVFVGGSSITDEAPDGSTSPTGNEIPTPNTVPQRKTSIVQPVSSKLSPQPIHHHVPDMSPVTHLETA